MRALFCGSRNWKRREVILLVMKNHLNPGDEVIHGAATGADRISGQVAQSLGLTTKEYPANWIEYGKSAGPRRNQQMIDTHPDILFAFVTPGSIGTWDCIRRAVTAGIPVHIYGSGGAPIIDGSQAILRYHPQDVAPAPA